MQKKESVLRVIKETVRKHGVLSAALLGVVCGAVIFALLPPLVLAQLIDLLTKKHTLWMEGFEISRGTVAASLLSAREILIRMLIVGATHFLICHNHPSGHLQPSKYDVDSTKNIVNAGRTIGIPLVDHLIIGDGRYVSLLEEYGKELFG